MTSFFRDSRLAITVLIALVCQGQITAVAQTKLALLVGVEEYQKHGFDTLTFAENDAKDLKTELERHGFTCDLLVGNEATAAKVRSNLAKLYDQSKALSKQDIVLVFMSGHGIQRNVYRRDDDNAVISTREELDRLRESKVRVRENEEPFFCPFDAHKNELSSLVNMNEIMQRLTDDSGASNNIVLLDACRESVDRGIKGVRFFGDTALLATYRDACTALASAGGCDMDGC